MADLFKYSKAANTKLYQSFCDKLENIFISSYLLTKAKACYKKLLHFNNYRRIKWDGAYEHLKKLSTAFLLTPLRAFH